MEKNEYTQNQHSWTEVNIEVVVDLVGLQWIRAECHLQHQYQHAFLKLLGTDNNYYNNKITNIVLF